MFGSIAAGFLSLLNLEAIFGMVAGLAVGLSFGAMPGLNATIGITLLLPVTFSLNPGPAMLMLIGVYCGATFAGSISAILIKTPGTAAASATVLEGYPMTLQGKAPVALSIALRGSVIGGVFSGLCLLFLAPQVAKLALKFGAPDYFMLAVFGLTIIASVSSQHLLKGIAMAALGLLATCIGIDPLQGTYRLTFGSEILARGVDLVPALIGLFAVSELLNQCEKKTMFMTRPPQVKMGHEHGWKDMMKYKWLMLRSSIIGVIVGACPGTGAAIAAFLSYGTAKSTSKEPEKYEHGSEEGLCASETANNAVTGATLIPMLTLGVPGDSVTAVLMGALTIQGLSPGSQLFVKYADMTYGVLVGFIVIQILMFFLGKLAIKTFSHLTKIPYYILLPMVMGFCVVGAYACSNNTTDILIAIVFGVIGYLAPKFNFPTTPMLIGIVLGNLAEQNLGRTLSVYGTPAILVQRPISLFFLVLSMISVGVVLIGKIRGKKVEV